MQEAISIIHSLIVWIIVFYIKASAQAILILAQIEITTDTAASRSTIKGMHASGRCLAGNTRVPVKEDAIGWGNWHFFKAMHCRGKCTATSPSDFRIVSACMFQLGHLRVLRTYSHLIVTMLWLHR